MTQKSLSRYIGKNNQEIVYFNLKRVKNKRAKTIANNPRPFLKWAGGKRQLIPQMDRYFPKKFNKFIEPFVGGGAIFFYLLPGNAVLIDKNRELMNTYKVIKFNVNELIELFKNHKNNEEYFYEIRNIDRNSGEYDKWTDIERASRTIYLNRCCYNGLYRVNSKGQFSVPFGKYKNPKFCNEANLIEVHKILQRVRLIHGSFETCLNFAEKGDFIYLDPPYMPISKSANFTSYTRHAFRKKDQLKLYEIFKTLDERNCKVMLSNSYSDFILDLFKDYQIKILRAKRSINSDVDKRGQVKEILILSYRI